MSSPLYVYGVVGRAAAEPVDAAGVGRDGPPVRMLANDALAAVVSRVPVDWTAAGRADVETHERVLEQLAADRTVVPMRFGVVMPSERVVREELLRRHEARLLELLAELDGSVQMSVKAYYAADALLGSVVARHPEFRQRFEALRDRPAARSQAARIELGRAVADAVEQQRARDRQALLEPIAAVARDVRVAPPGGEREALSVQVLIERARSQRLDQVVRDLSQRHRGRLGFRYVGPLPAYSFTDLALAASEPSWA